VEVSKRCDVRWTLRIRVWRQARRLWGGRQEGTQRSSGLTRCDAARIWCGGFLSRDRHADRARQPDRGTLANVFDLVADPCARDKKRGHANQTASAAPALGDRITGDSVVCHAGAKCESLAPQTCAAPEGSRRADAVRQPERRVHCRQAQGKVLRPAVRADKATFPRRGLSRSDSESRQALRSRKPSSPTRIPTPMRRSIAFSRANSTAPDTRGTGSMFYDTLKSTAPWRRVRNPLLQMTTTPNE
jgi:hypothetical protein